MKRASVSTAKNNLSALLDRVRSGQTVVIEDRGVPVARLEPITRGAEGSDRLARLERQGIVTPARRELPASFFSRRPPRLPRGRSVSALLLAERREGR